MTVGSSKVNIPVADKERKKRIPMKKNNKTALPVTGAGKQHNFFEDVWDVARQIPRGRATSYGAIAAYLGAKSSARMVGWAMNGAHANKRIPAHRVVNRNGMLSGRAHFSPPEKMQQLLEKEGIKVVDNAIVDFAKVFWDPAIELGF